MLASSIPIHIQEVLLISIYLIVYNIRLKKFGAVSIQTCRLTSIGIPILKIRRSRDRLIFNMGILYPGKTVFILRQGPGRSIWLSMDMVGMQSLVRVIKPPWPWINLICFWRDAINLTNRIENPIILIWLTQELFPRVQQNIQVHDKDLLSCEIKVHISFHWERYS